MCCQYRIFLAFKSAQAWICLLLLFLAKKSSPCLLPLSTHFLFSSLAHFFRLLACVFCLKRQEANETLSMEDKFSPFLSLGKRVQNKDWIKKTRRKTRQIFISYVVCQKEDCFFKTTLKTCLNPSQDVFTWLDFFSHLCASLVFVVNVSALLLLSYFSCEKKGSWETIFNATSSLTSSLFFFLPSSCFARRRFDLLVCFQKVQNRQECTRRRW